VKNLSRSLWSRCSGNHFKSLGKLHDRALRIRDIYDVRRIWFTRTDTHLSCVVSDRLRLDVRKIKSAI